MATALPPVIQPGELGFVVTLAGSASLSAAARELGLSKAAVSKRLALIEQRSGVALVNRTTRRMSLTPEGEIVAECARRILGEIDELGQSLQRSRQAPRGLLRVNATLGFGRSHVAPVISRFVKRHPEVEMQLQLSVNPPPLTDDAFDVCIRFGEPPDARVIARRLAPIQAVMCASPAYLERMGTPQAPEQLVKHRCLVYNLISNSDNWNVHDTAGQSIKTRIIPYLKASNGEFLRDAAVGGLGIVLLPAFIVYREIERGALVPILTGYHYTQLAAYAIYPQTRHLSQRVRAFVDFLSKRFEGMPYWDSCLHNANNKS